MTPKELEKLHGSLAVIGKNESLRQRLIDECKHIEKVLAAPGFAVRDVITGPIVDALHTDVGVQRKRIANGMTFEFHYRSKIARELVMSTPDVPDHVWEPQTTKLLLHLARGANNVLVGGAYFGDQALLVARQIAQNGGVVHAFELNPDQAAMLGKNAQINELTNVRLNQKGLWDDETTYLGLEGDDSFAHPTVIDAGTGKDPRANTYTVDAYLGREGVQHVDLVMLDVEGGEHRILKGARGQLALPVGKAPNLVFEVHRSYVDWSRGLEKTEIVELVRSFGYELFAVRDFQQNQYMGDSPIELVPLATTYLEGPPHGFNVVAVKDKAILDGVTFRFVDGVSPKLLVHKDPKLHHPIGGLRQPT